MALDDFPLEILFRRGDPSLAELFVARFRGRDDLVAEFVDARDPLLPPEEKWVIIISTQFGCPASCLMCDAGGDYLGDLTAKEMEAEIRAVVARHHPERLRRVKKLKVQFARMGEPALNPAVLSALRGLPAFLPAEGLIPCIASIAPRRSRAWFEELLCVRHEVYGGRPFQLQLSLNSTDEAERDRIMPLAKMGFEELGLYAARFAATGPRKVGLNFALTEAVPVEPTIVARHFDPAHCCVKITPLNPTRRSAEHGLQTALPPEAPREGRRLCEAFERLGFEAILSIGDVRENGIGSNCGMATCRVVEETFQERTR